MTTKRKARPAEPVPASSLADAVTKQMPGWKLAGKGSTAVDSIAAAGDSQEAQQGVDVAALRRKFLGSKSSSIDAALSRDRPHGASAVEVFRVEPSDGGPTRVADRRDGKISIVSG